MTDSISGRVRDLYPPHGQGKVAANPVVIFEVLSESTFRTDMTTKNEEYANTPSVRRYVMLMQDAPSGTMFERSGADWVWRLLPADSVLRMPEIGIEVPLADFYEGVEFSEAA